MTGAKTLADLLPLAAERGGESVALIGFDTELSWAETEIQVRALASTLVVSGVRPGDRIALAMNKTHRSFLAVHAILRAGAVVVPVDPLAAREAARSRTRRGRRRCVFVPAP